MEAVAAAGLLRSFVPDLRVRFVNVVDLMRLFPADAHPHGLDPLTFADVFTRGTDVVFALHGYARAVHELVHGHVGADRFHVRGYREQGTTTTPFDMVVKKHEPLPSVPGSAPPCPPAPARLRRARRALRPDAG
jgi:xylulose-5-phosphate/fructose-6-phosphate phosphoketolase